MRACILVVVAACGAASVPQPRQTIDSQGAEPRRILRITPALHAVEAFELTIKRRVATRTTDTTFQVRDATTDEPSMKIVAHAEVIGREPDGASRVLLVADDATLLEDVVDPGLRARLERQLAKFKGQRVEQRITSAGVVDKGLATVDTLTLELPSQPMGLDGRWTADDAPVIDGIHWTRHTTYHVRALTEASATIDVAVTLRAETQPLRVEPNATTRLTSGTGTATSTMTLRFDRAVVASDAHSTLEMNLQIVRGHARVESTVTSESWLSLVPRD